VETGKDRQRFVCLDNEHKRVWETAQQGTAHVLVDHGELTRIGGHTFDHDINGRAEASAQAGDFSLVPILRVGQFRASGQSKGNRILRATLLKLGFQSSPRDTFAPVLVERGNAAVNLCLLRSR
jgi:hypothetical protein